MRVDAGVKPFPGDCGLGWGNGGYAARLLPAPQAMKAKVSAEPTQARPWKQSPSHPVAALWQLGPAAWAGAGQAGLVVLVGSKPSIYAPQLQLQWHPVLCSTHVAAAAPQAICWLGGGVFFLPHFQLLSPLPCCATLSMGR